MKAVYRKYIKNEKMEHIIWKKEKNGLATRHENQIGKRIFNFSADF